MTQKASAFVRLFKKGSSDSSNIMRHQQSELLLTIWMSLLSLCFVSRTVFTWVTNSKQSYQAILFISLIYRWGKKPNEVRQHMLCKIAQPVSGKMSSQPLESKLLVNSYNFYLSKLNKLYNPQKRISASH